MWTLGQQRQESALSNKVFRCPQAKGGRREAGREEVLGKLGAGNPLLLYLGFVVLGFIPFLKERYDFCLHPRETQLMEENSLETRLTNYL